MTRSFISNDLFLTKRGDKKKTKKKQANKTKHVFGAAFAFGPSERVSNGSLGLEILTNKKNLWGMWLQEDLDSIWINVIIVSPVNKTIIIIIKAVLFWVELEEEAPAKADLCDQVFGDHCVIYFFYT